MIDKSLSVAVAALISIVPNPIVAQTPIQPVTQYNRAIGLDRQLIEDRAALIEAIDHSLRYLNTPQAALAYRNYNVPGVTLQRVQQSLQRFQQLLLTTKTPEQLQQAVQREFVFYRSVGNSSGEVHFTGYFEPVYQASRVPTAEYRYPLYRKPADFDSWNLPHPTRADIEGTDGLLGAASPLAGYELVWLRDRLEAFLIGVQGSARLELTDGSVMSVGFDGNTDYPYVSIGKELVQDGKFKAEEITLPVLLEYFRENPTELDVYLPRNNRLIFFKSTNGRPPTGSLSTPVTAERSIATDKSIMPPGALALVYTEIPYPNQTGELENRLVSRYVLDQDTGSAIKGPGRVDIFLGTGELAGDRAGVLTSTGELYYLLLKQ